jgi:uracil-DNA glycosylase
MVRLGNDWDELLQDEFRKDYYLKLREFLKEEYRTKTIYPDKYDIFNALRLCAHRDVKVVILGQDPYHGAGQAHGLAFSVQPGVDIPPSLLNIYKELRSDLGCYLPNHGCLTSWAEQGVLLLNACLTVRANSAASHRGKGWEHFTDRVIELVNNKPEPVVFLLWGNHAREKGRLVTNPVHLILNTVHPSPLSASRGFFGCRHFSQANTFLRESGQREVHWQIPNLSALP